MKNKTLLRLSKKVQRNAPTILTIASIVSGLTTTGLALWEGYKLCEDWNDIPDDATTLDKAKVLAPRVGPVIVGATFSTGCAIAAHHTNAQKYAALMATVAAMNADKIKLREKAEAVVGKDKVNQIRGYVAKDKASEVSGKIQVSPGERIRIHDLETGYIFECTLKDFYDQLSIFNEKLEYNQYPIASFYESLLGDNYISASLHQVVGFGPETDTCSFRPEWGSEVMKDMSICHTIQYPYATLS